MAHILDGMRVVYLKIPSNHFVLVDISYVVHKSELSLEFDNKKNFWVRDTVLVVAYGVLPVLLIVIRVSYPASLWTWS